MSDEKTFKGSPASTAASVTEYTAAIISRMFANVDSTAYRYYKSAAVVRAEAYGNHLARQLGDYARLLERGWRWER